MNLNQTIKLIKTSDGSHTLAHPLGDHFHSTHGAIQEAIHVFIKTGLNNLEKRNVSILEVGFGTGLNAFLTYLNKCEKNITYIGLEPNPLEMSLIKQLNYTELLNQNKHIFHQFHELSFDTWYRPEEAFKFLKYQQTLEAVTNVPSIDIIYFDAFAPRYQPHLWESNMFEKCYEFLNPGGILVTYCAKGSVKRNLRDAGFSVETCPGPPGKREMIRARKVINV
jgi:tRNA U34 5-methylaminomethyl-2-thiouridine-forming methyltransferase MnmC